MGVEPAEKNVMQRLPVRSTDSIFAGGMVRDIAWVGVLTGLIALAVGVAVLGVGSPVWQTMIFTTLCFSQVGQALAMRAEPRFIVQDWAAEQSLVVRSGAGGGGSPAGAIYLPFMHRLHVHDAAAVDGFVRECGRECAGDVQVWGD